jgi:hypothetical protein
MACASTAMSPRDCVRCSWSTTHSVALASLCTKPCSMADSRPSEYENPPIGSAGDASQISCNRPDGAVSVLMLAVGAVHMGRGRGRADWDGDAFGDGRGSVIVCAVGAVHMRFSDSGFAIV